MDSYGCSSQPEGVDDDTIGVIMNYVCSCVLIMTSMHLWRTFGWSRARAAILTEAGMAVGYFTGGLSHSVLANRAHDDDCANRYFYPTFCTSYLSMILSSLAWLSAADALPRVDRRSRSVFTTRVGLLLAAVLIAAGACQCTASLRLFSGPSDPCPTTSQALCDATMMAGEG